ncbi:MAG: hypothetical protein K6L74_07850 [Neptuniibacter sp.]
MAKPLLIAVPVENGIIAEHAGRALDWDIYFSGSDGLVQFGWQIQLDEEACLHLWHVRADGGNRHPIHSVDVVVARSAGKGVIQRLLERDTHVYITKQFHPERAALAFLHGLLENGYKEEDDKPQDIHACGEAAEKEQEINSHSNITF